MASVTVPSAYSSVHECTFMEEVMGDVDIRKLSFTPYETKSLIFLK